LDNKFEPAKACFLTCPGNITFENPGGDPHRKACLLIRQNLDDDSAYADAALHGDGLTSLQYREAKRAMTRERQSNLAGPRRLRLEKRGKYVSMSVAGWRGVAAGRRSRAGNHPWFNGFAAICFERQG